MSIKKKTVKVLSLCVAFAAAVALIIAFMPEILEILGYTVWLFAPFLLAYGVSLLVNPMADALQKRFRLPRGISAVLVIVLTVGILGGIITGVVWKLVDEIRGVYEDLPVIYMEIRDTWQMVSETLSDISARLPVSLQSAMNDVSNQFFGWLADIATGTHVVQSAGNVAKKLPSIFIASIVFLLSLYFMVTDSELVSKVVKKPFSAAIVERMTEFRLQIKRYVGGYVKAQLIIMCISFTLILIGLSILKIDYALIIALATAIFDALPFFGSGAVLIPWAIISFITGSFINGVGLIIIYLSVILTRQLVEPKIVSKNIGMHPILTLMSMYIGFKVFSIGGMILGPLVMVVSVSLYRVGALDGVINSAKRAALGVRREIQKIKSSFDEGE